MVRIRFSPARSSVGSLVGNPVTSPRSRPLEGHSDAGIVYLAAVQLSHNPSTQVLEGRPSRSLGQGRPCASIPLRVSRAPAPG